SSSRVNRGIESVHAVWHSFTGEWLGQGRRVAMIGRLAHSRGSKAIALAMVAVVLGFTKGAAAPCDPETVGVDTSRGQGLAAAVGAAGARQVRFFHPARVQLSVHKSPVRDHG